MSSAKMLGKSGDRRLLVPSRGRCSCAECAIQPLKQTQRARERRAWQREELDDA